MYTVLYYKYVQEHLSKSISVYFPVPHVQGLCLSLPTLVCIIDEQHILTCLSFFETTTRRWLHAFISNNSNLQLFFVILVSVNNKKHTETGLRSHLKDPKRPTSCSRLLLKTRAL